MIPTAARVQPNICANAVIVSRFMDRQLLEPSQMDGELTYRYDSTGHQVALLPARCKLGRHTLSHSQFRAVVQDGEATISCLACATDSTDHFWRLSASTPAPDLAELSDELYADLALRRAQRTTSPAGNP